MLRSKVLEMIKMSVQINKFGRPTYLNSDEESLVIVSAEIEGAYGLPIYVNTLGIELKLVIKAVNSRQSTKEITPKTSSKYTRLLFNRVKKTEDGHDKQRKEIRTGLVNVSIISNNRARRSDPRLAWLMFHKIAKMYRYIREQENEEATKLILNLRSNLNSNNTSSS